MGFILIRTAFHPDIDPVRPIRTLSATVIFRFWSGSALAEPCWTIFFGRIFLSSVFLQSDNKIIRMKSCVWLYVILCRNWVSEIHHNARLAAVAYVTQIEPWFSDIICTMCFQVSQYGGTCEGIVLLTHHLTTVILNWFSVDNPF
jgi:hypothetical protein